MTSSKSLLVTGMLLASTAAVTAQTTNAQIHSEAKLTLDYFGKGYAAALLGSVAPSTEQDPKAIKPRTIKLANGTLSLVGSAKDKNLAVSELRLTRGDFRELGLRIGETPVEVLIRNYGQPEKREARRLVYRGISEICVDHLVFHVGDGLLQGIEWDWCYD